MGFEKKKHAKNAKLLAFSHPYSIHVYTHTHTLPLSLSLTHTHTHTHTQLINAPKATLS